MKHYSRVYFYLGLKRMTAHNPFLIGRYLLAQISMTENMEFKGLKLPKRSMLYYV